MYEKQDDYIQTENVRNMSGNRQRRKNRRKRNNRLRRICGLFVAAVFFGSTAGCSAYIVNDYLSREKTGSGSIAAAAVVSNEKNTFNAEESSAVSDISSIAKNGLNSVVSITNISVQEVQNYFSRFGRGGMGGPIQTQQSTSVGSGVIVYIDDSTLYMVTNYHVVEDATTLSVTFVNDETYEAALCGYDENRDIAVLKVSVSQLSSGTISSITEASIGSSDELVVGEQVVAIGNALGYGQSVTTGIVSAMNRTVESDVTSNTYLQTDAAINPGNSGGALFNMKGELVGINTAKIATTGVEGIGYAIPISDVLELIGSMMSE